MHIYLRRLIWGVVLTHRSIGLFAAEPRLLPVAAVPATPLILWCRQPAAKWEEALAIGSGRIGAMVFGGVRRERLQLNEDTLWAGGPYDSVNPAARGAFEVDIAWDGGKLTSVRIRSVGGHKAIVRYGGRTKEIELEAGEAVRLNSGLQRVAKSS